MRIDLHAPSASPQVLEIQVVTAQHYELLRLTKLQAAPPAGYRRGQGYFGVSTSGGKKSGCSSFSQIRLFSYSKDEK